MRWDAVILALEAELPADPTLLRIFGANVRLAGTGPLLVPLLELSLVADSEGELWAPVVVQFDLWTATLDDARAAERQLRRRFHTELPTQLGGLEMLGQYVDGDMLATPEGTAQPDRHGFYGRAIRFRFTPLRECYA